ncbi:hypothetical protein SAMN05428977_10792 [Nitrosomonas sp. Nm166]|nr:hypothetical protein SAMN05428977_10792 [Nitrosomonas sp. Nm166]
MSTRKVDLSQHDYHQRHKIAYAKENTVFIVRANAILEFLKHFDVPDNTIRQLRYN